jgi:ActR/RegA family two-component response regulator
MHTTAVSAIREGAEDYLPKPITDDELNRKSLRKSLSPATAV